MTFQNRYLSEGETPQTIQNEIKQASDFTSRNDVKDKPDGISDVAAVSTATATVPLVQSVENINDAHTNRTSNDAKTAGDTMTRGSRNTVQDSSRTPFNVSINESNDPLAQFRGPYHNTFSKKIKNLGLSIGNKEGTNAKKVASQSGNKNILSGTKASFTMGKKDLGRHAKDSLNTAQNVPGKNDIRRATTSSIMDSTYFELSKKINYLIQEYTDMDVKWGTNAPGNVKTGRTISHGVDESHNKTSDTTNMVKNMNQVINTKQAAQVKTRAATMPEINKDKAMDQTAGLHIQRSNIVHGADQTNANVRQQREQRMQANQSKDQQDG